MIGKQAEVSNAMEAQRQDMDQETTDELIGGELHGFEAFLTIDAVVFPAKGNAMVVIIDDAAI